MRGLYYNGRAYSFSARFLALLLAVSLNGENHKNAVFECLLIKKLPTSEKIFIFI